MVVAAAVVLLMAAIVVGWFEKMVLGTEKVGWWLLQEQERAQRAGEWSVV